MRGVGHTCLREQLERVHHPLITQARIELKRWRKAARTARRTVRILHAQDRLAVLARRCRVREKGGIISDQERRIRLLAAGPGRPALGRESFGEHGDERSLHTSNPIVRSVGVEADIPEHARIEEGHLHVLPIFLVNRSVPLQAPVEELRLPAELAVGQIIGGVRQRRAVLRDTAGVRNIAGGGSVERARTETL